MQYKDFKNYLDAIRNADKFMDDAYQIGINMIDSTIYDTIGTLTTGLFSLEYGEEGAEWVSYVLYELPSIKEYDEKHPEKQKKEGYAWDANGKVIHVEDDVELWKYLETEYKVKRE